MPQSSAIVAFIGLAFLVFITQKGELRLYMGFLLGESGTASATAPATTSANAAPTVSSALGWLNSAAALLGG